MFGSLVQCPPWKRTGRTLHPKASTVTAVHYKCGDGGNAPKISEKNSCIFSSMSMR